MSRILTRKFALLSVAIAMFVAFSLDVHAQPQQPSKKERKRAEQLIKDGDKAFGVKNYQEAVNKYGEALTILPNSSVAHYLKGQAHFFLGEYDPAASELSLALKNGHKPMEVMRIRWEAYDKLKRYDEALADVNAILAADSGNFQFQLQAANLYYNKGAYKEAADAYMKAIPKAPNSADLYYRVADAKSKLGDIDGQASAADEAIKRNTQYLADALLLLGRARYAQKRIPEAIDAYSRALTARPDKLESYRQLAELQRSQNQIEEGIKTLEEGKRRNATNGEVYKDLALFYSLVEGKKDEAIEAGKSATQLLPNDPVAHTNLCRAYHQGGKFDSAVSSCNTALKLDPENGESLFFLARAIRDRDAKDPKKSAAEVEKIYKRAVASMLAYTKDKPEDADGFYMLGNAYADQQQNALAVEAYRKALELNPKLARAYYNMGVIRVNEGNKTGALEQYNVLLAIDKALAEKLKGHIDTL